MKAYHFKGYCKSAIKKILLNNEFLYNINAVKNNLSPFISFNKQRKFKNTKTIDKKINLLLDMQQTF